MTVILIIAIGAGALSLLSDLVPFLPLTRNKLRYTKTINLNLPQKYAQESIEAFFRALGCTERTEQGGIWIYQRGLMKIRRMDRVLPVRFIPHFVAVGFDPHGSQLIVTIAYRAMPGVKFADLAASCFLDSIRIEADAICELLQKVADDLRHSGESRNHDERGVVALAADFASLGLNPDASWEQVHAAYRMSCKKFHPDHLAGQQVPPHLADLASQRFKECTAAYQRLKQQMS